MPTFLISCGASKVVQLVGAESVKAFEVAFRKVMHEMGGVPAAAPSVALPNESAKHQHAAYGERPSAAKAAAEE